MKLQLKRSHKHLFCLILLSYIFFFYGIGDYSLKEPDEGRYAEIPREMVELNDYIVPHLNYVRYFEKPPLLYWAIAASYKLFGVNEWAFRFPNSLFAFICTIVLYLMIKRWDNSEVAFLSSIILLSSFGFFSMARIVTIDMLFSLLLFLSLLFFYGYYREKKALFIYFFYIALGLATLAKGFVPVVLVAVTVFIFLVAEKKLSFLKELKWIKGLSLYGLITLPWFISISLKEEGFFYFFVIDQHVLRFLTTKHKRTGSIFYFFPVLLCGMFPWSLFIPRGVIQFWNRSNLKLFIIWSFVVFCFFSFSKSKLPTYILPIFPALSVIIGYLFYEKWHEPGKGRIESYLYIFIFMLFGITSILGITGALNQWVSQISSDSVIVLGSLKYSLAVLSVISIATLCLLCYRKLNSAPHTFCILSAFSLLFLCTLLFNLKTLDAINTTKRIGMLINEQIKEGDFIVNYASFDHTLPFYTKKRIIIVSYKGELEMGSAYNDTKAFFINEEGYANLFHGDKKVFTVLKAKRLNRLKEKTSKALNIIDCRNDRCLISNK